ncbi:hypothetical protein ACIBG0_06095 [Nocardia sp. NPDC050630]|uniref:hypothetical protein n=1 Tax=Nocardia sp. NPDC050630 TaxID=3364321 RepID=UPI0037965136
MPLLAEVAKPTAQAQLTDSGEAEAIPQRADISEPEARVDIEVPATVPLLADAAERGAVAPPTNIREPFAVSDPISGDDTKNPEGIRQSPDTQEPEVVSPPMDLDERRAAPLPVDVGEFATAKQRPVEVGEPGGAPPSPDAAEPPAVALPADIREPDAVSRRADGSELTPVCTVLDMAAPAGVPLLADVAKPATEAQSGDLRGFEALPPAADISDPESVHPQVDTEAVGAVPLPADMAEPEGVALPATVEEPPLPICAREPESEQLSVDTEAAEVVSPSAPGVEVLPAGIREHGPLPRAVDVFGPPLPANASERESGRALVDIEMPEAVLLPADVRVPESVPQPTYLWEPETARPLMDSETSEAVALSAGAAEPTAVVLPTDIPGPEAVLESAHVRELDAESLPVDVQPPGAGPLPVYVRESEVVRPPGEGFEPETGPLPVYVQEFGAMRFPAYPDVEMSRPSADSVDSVTPTTAVELAAQHGLDVIGFDGPNVDTYVVREVTAAVDDMLTRYPIALRGIQITDPDDSAPAMCGASRALPQSDSSAIWMVLDGGALATLVPEAGNARPRRWLRRRRNADRPVYAAVVREFGCALDVAGDFRARHEAQRRLITESLRGSADLAYNPLDPSLALLDAFTDFALHGDRAGKLAKELHDMLVKMARAESTDLSA